MHLVYIGQTGDKLADIPASNASIDAVYTVRAGKFRRYHGEGLSQVFDTPTLLKNIRDFFFVVIGTFQSYRLLKNLKPAVIFTPGGFVGVPVGIAASRRHIPFITHDLDAIPGLANRINARWAVAHAVALPPETYDYPPDKTFYVGVPVSEMYQPVTHQMQLEYRKGLKIEPDARVLCITGGGNGAERLNNAVAKIAPELLHHYPNLVILHIAGRKNEADLNKLYNDLIDNQIRNRVIVKGFVDDLYRYSAAANVVVARAGATNMAEFALQHRPCIVVPNPALTGGHQLKNAQQLEKAGAIKVVSENDMEQQLLPSIRELFDFSAKREALGDALGKFAKPEATKQLAELILSVVS